MSTSTTPMHLITAAARTSDDLHQEYERYVRSQRYGKIPVLSKVDWLILFDKAVSALVEDRELINRYSAYREAKKSEGRTPQRYELWFREEIQRPAKLTPLNDKA